MDLQISQPLRSHDTKEERFNKKKQLLPKDKLLTLRICQDNSKYPICHTKVIGEDNLFL